MARNIAGQALYQLGLLFFLLYEGPKLWGLEAGNYCRSWTGGNSKTQPTWRYNGVDYSCNDFQSVCAAYFGPGNTGACGGAAENVVEGRRVVVCVCDVWRVHNDMTRMRSRWSISTFIPRTHSSTTNPHKHTQGSATRSS
jgi:hypothetical protein